jgi:hypothetical protein
MLHRSDLQHVILERDFSSVDHFCLLNLSIYGSTALFGPWLLFQRLDFLHSRRTALTGNQPVARPLHTHRTTHHRTNTHRHHASSELRTHYPSISASEDGSCLRAAAHQLRQDKHQDMRQNTQSCWLAAYVKQRGHCDRQDAEYRTRIKSSDR